MKRSLGLLVGVAAAVLALDYGTKQWVMGNLSYQQPMEILGPYLRFTYTRNSGVAFGLGAGTNFPYYVFSIVAAVAIVYLFVRSRVRTLGRQLSLALILGGALGNLVDRLRWGEVVDFIEVGFQGWHWPVFNVADSAVTVGVVLFALTWSAHDRRVASAGGSEAGTPPSPTTRPTAMGTPARDVVADVRTPHAQSPGSGPERG